MSVPLLIPTRNDLPDYTQQVTLDGTLYTLHFRFNLRMNRWILEIWDGPYINLLVGNLLLSPSYPLNYRFAQKWPGPPGILILQDETGQNRVPTRTMLGVDGINLYYWAVSA